MIHVTPRQSSLFGLRESNRKAVRIASNTIGIYSPAYSVDSGIVACGFNGSTEDNLLMKRTPPASDGQEFTGTKINGGGCWVPSVNKFYFGCAQHGVESDEMVMIADPVTRETSFIGGFSHPASSSTGKEAIYIPSAGEVWVELFATGSNEAFAVIDPDTETLVTIIASPLLAGLIQDFTYCPTMNAVYVACFGSLVKIDVATRAVSTVYDEAAFEAQEGTTISSYRLYSCAYIVHEDYADGLICYGSSYIEGSAQPYPLSLFDPTTNLLVGTLGGGDRYDFLYYAEEFHRLIVSYSTPPGFLNHPTLSYIPETGAGGVIVSLGTDRLSAAKGVYCDNIDKIALPVLTGDPADRHYTLNFYGASDL